MIQLTLKRKYFNMWVAIFFFFFLDCYSVLWKLDINTYHIIFLDDDASFMFPTFSLGNKVSISSTIITAWVAPGTLLSEVQLPWKERLRKEKTQTLFTKCFVGFLSYPLPYIPIQEVKLDDLFINKNCPPEDIHCVNLLFMKSEAYGMRE